MTYNQGTKINLRVHKDEDFDAYFLALNNPLVQEGQGTFTPVSEKAARKYFDEESDPDSGDFRFIIETKEGVGVGQVVLMRIDRQNRRGQAALCIWNPDNWGRGYATEATGLLLKFAFEELCLHKVSLHNGVFEFNKGAIKVYEKCGFRREGIRREEYFHKGRWWDVIDMGILENEYFNK